MTKTETIRLFALIAAAYPRDKAFAEASPTMIDMWAKLLADIPLQVVEQALAAHVSTSPFPPAIAEIRGWACGGGPGDTAQEAWGKVMLAIRRHGIYEPKQARELMGADVWQVLLQVFPTWERICVSENVEADRAHFFKAWEARERREKLRTQLPQNVQAALPGDRRLLGGQG